MICWRCDGRLRRAAVGVERVLNGFAVDGCVAACEYEDEARRLVAAVKFSKRIALAEVAAELLADAIPKGLLNRGLGGLPPPVLVPVPPDPWRSRWRGFDSAGEIARHLGERLGLEVRPLLIRQHGRRQVGRHREERLDEPPSVKVKREATVPASAVLVDDVITTGATVGACAHALRMAGADRIVAVAFATSSGRPRGRKGERRKDG